MHDKNKKHWSWIILLLLLWSLLFWALAANQVFEIWSK